MKTAKPFNLSDSLPLAKTHFGPYEVWLARTKTNPPFWLPVYRAKADGRWEDFGNSITSVGYFEQHETESFLRTITHSCRVNPENLVVDVGGFNGYYTMLAATSGCRVQVWEAQPHNVVMVQFAVLMNRLWNRVQVHHKICSNGTMPMRFTGTAMDGHVSGTYSRSDNEQRQKQMAEWGLNDDPNEGVLVEPLSIDNAVKERVLLMKIDVEGYEPHVIAGADKLLRAGMIENILMEYNMWRAMKLEEGVDMVGKLLDYSYYVYVQPTPKCQRSQILTRDDIRSISLKLQNHSHPCGQWTVYLLATRTPYVAT
jgi:FkbM family methyltransferase